MKIDEFTEDYLAPLLHKLSLSKKKCFLMGDFNIDLLKCNSKPAIQNYYNTFLSHFYSPFILQPTRVTNSSKTLIDNIFFNSLEYESYSGNVTIEISDHLIQFVFLKDFKTPAPLPKHNFWKRDYTFFNNDEFDYDLQQIEWHDILNNNNSINKNFDTFFKTVEAVLNDHAPYKKLTRKEFKLRSKPWINTGIQNMMFKRDKLFHKYCTEKCIENKQILHEEYKIIRNKVRNSIFESKKQYFQSYFSENEKNISNIWKGIKQVIQTSRKAMSNTITLGKGNDEVNDPIDVANSFSNFFCECWP